ncbi:MAG: DUF2306 domain-containing protein [Sciscionella sp.]|nr:DUF2306 domain-containing protein [Sciscionella sp.]
MMTPFVAVHAFIASLALVLGAYNLIRKPKGDRRHKLIGRVWVASMYYVAISSFWIQHLNHGHLSPIHIISVVVLVTLTAAMVAVRTGRIGLHRVFVVISYVALVGAFVGAVVVPKRAIPQTVTHHPFWFAIAVLACALLGVVVIRAGRRGAPAGDGRQDVRQRSTAI